MESKAVAKYVRIAPRKVRVVMDLIRGKNVAEAFAILKFTPKVQTLRTIMIWTLTSSSSRRLSLMTAQR